jgi:hypothetical protein
VTPLGAVNHRFYILGNIVSLLNNELLTVSSKIDDMKFIVLWGNISIFRKCSKELVAHRKLVVKFSHSN